MNSITPIPFQQPRKQPIRFSGIYANADETNGRRYLAAFSQYPDQHRLSKFATKIFRELPTTLAAVRLMGNRPTDVHILGSSDGSQAFAYAMAIRRKGGSNVKNTVKITGVDYTPYLVELAQTGYLVCTDQERADANDRQKYPGHPLAGDEWNRYLQRTDSPPGFEDLVSRYPDLGQITRDSVSNISVDHGMQWYKVQQEDLPPIQFEQGNIREYVQKDPTPGRQQVYVLANAVSYIFNQDGPAAFIKVFQDIQNRNNRGNTYVVLGELEKQVARYWPDFHSLLARMGYERVSRRDLEQLGLRRGQVEVAEDNIWRIKPGPQVSITSLTG